MTVLTRVLLAGLASCFLLGTAGCTKTSDGSIEFHRPNMTGGLFGAQPVEMAGAAQVAFPQPPPPAQAEQVTVRRNLPARTVRRNGTAPQSAEMAQSDVEAAPTLNCRNETQVGGRVKFVCR